MEIEGETEMELNQGKDQHQDLEEDPEKGDLDLDQEIEEIRRKRKLQEGADLLREIDQEKIKEEDLCQGNVIQVPDRKEPAEERNHEDHSLCLLQD